MNIAIRKIDAESARLAAELEKLCFSEPWSEKAILEEAERGYFVAAYIDGVFAGYAGMLCVLDERDVCNIATVPEFRGKGVGKAIYHHICRYAKSEGFYNVTLNVWSCNPGALKFYEKLGLVPQKIGMEQVLDAETE